MWNPTHERTAAEGRRPHGAGKSTLIKLLSGVYPKDSGRFLLDGAEVAIHSVHDAQRLGITTIYQEMNLVPELTIAQNIFLGREPKDPRWLKTAVDRRARDPRPILDSSASA